MPALPGAAVIASATRFNVASNPVQELMDVDRRAGSAPIGAVIL